MKNAPEKIYLQIKDADPSISGVDDFNDLITCLIDWEAQRAFISDIEYTRSDITQGSEAVKEFKGKLIANIQNSHDYYNEELSEMTEENKDFVLVQSLVNELAEVIKIIKETEI